HKPRWRHDEAPNFNSLPIFLPFGQPIAIRDFAPRKIKERRRQQTVNAKRVEQSRTHSLNSRRRVEVTGHGNSRAVNLARLSSQSACFHQTVLDSFACVASNTEVDGVPGSIIPNGIGCQIHSFGFRNSSTKNTQSVFPLML